MEMSRRPGFWGAARIGFARRHVKGANQEGFAFEKSFGVKRLAQVKVGVIQVVPQFVQQGAQKRFGPDHVMALGGAHPDHHTGRTRIGVKMPCSSLRGSRGRTPRISTRTGSTPITRQTSSIIRWADWLIAASEPESSVSNSAWARDSAAPLGTKLYWPMASLLR